MKWPSIFSFMFAMFGLLSCNQAQQKTISETKATPQKFEVGGETLDRVEKTEEEWKAQLSEQGYYVLRKAGTERSFTGKYWDNKEKGVYTCGGCGLPLFDSETKFKSGTGWPSFFKPIKEDYILEKSDDKFGMQRVEVLCARCDGHLGHVFPDGPAPTGLRYCINSVSLNFEKKP